MNDKINISGHRIRTELGMNKKYMYMPHKLHQHMKIFWPLTGSASSPENKTPLEIMYGRFVFVDMSSVAAGKGAVEMSLVACRDAAAVAETHGISGKY